MTRRSLFQFLVAIIVGRRAAPSILTVPSPARFTQPTVPTKLSFHPDAFKIVFQPLDPDEAWAHPGRAYAETLIFGEFEE